MSYETEIETFKNVIEDSGKAINERIKKLEDRLQTGLTDLAQQSQGFGSMPGATPKSAGAKFAAQFKENQELFQRTKSVSLDLGAEGGASLIKAAGDTITTTSGRNVIAGGVGMVSGGVVGIQNALRTRTVTGVSGVEYSRFTGTQGAAGVQAAEGDLKAAVRPNHSIIQQSAIQIAGWASMSRQAMSDSAELTRAVEVTLARSCAIALDTALVDGVVAPAFAGYKALATPFSSLFVYTADMVSDAVATMQEAGFNPDVAVMSPQTWLGIVTTKDINGEYLSNNYLGMVANELRGLRVVLSSALVTDEVLVMDTQHSDLLIEAFTISVGTVNTQFIQNEVTLLGEMRVTPIYRTVGSAVLVNGAVASI